MGEQNKYMMGEDRIPHAWYNIMADLPSPPPPVLHPLRHSHISGRGCAHLPQLAGEGGAERRMGCGPLLRP
jgi:tryptophan synthase beta chain